MNYSYVVQTTLQMIKRWQHFPTMRWMEHSVSSSHSGKMGKTIVSTMGNATVWADFSSKINPIF